MRTHQFGRLLPLLLALSTPALPAIAETAVGARAGTTGFGLELGTSLNSSFDARIVVSGIDYADDFSSSTLDYDGDAELRFLSALLDWHPGPSAFRITLGLVYNDSTLVATAPLLPLVAVEAPELVPFIPPGTIAELRGEAVGNEIAPWAGLGWGRVSGRSGWGWSLDLGVIWLGEPEVTLALETNLPIDAVPEARPLVDALLEQERRELEEDVEDYTFLPVVSFGLAYRF